MIFQNATFVGCVFRTLRGRLNFPGTWWLCFSSKSITDNACTVPGTYSRNAGQLLYGNSPSDRGPLVGRSWRVCRFCYFVFIFLDAPTAEVGYTLGTPLQYVSWGTFDGVAVNASVVVFASWLFLRCCLCFHLSPIAHCKQPNLTYPCGRYGPLLVFTANPCRNREKSSELARGLPKSYLYVCFCVVFSGCSKVVFRTSPLRGMCFTFCLKFHVFIRFLAKKYFEATK